MSAGSTSVGRYDAYIGLTESHTLAGRATDLTPSPQSARSSRFCALPEALRRFAPRQQPTQDAQGCGRCVIAVLFVGRFGVLGVCAGG